MMKTLLIVYWLLVVALLTGCTTAPRVSDMPAEPETPMRSLCESGKYHEAMRELPKAMAAWEEYTKRTGRTVEGAAGYEYVTTMSAIASKGDADWGKILDDPEIPYVYKTEMVFEIFETRLGKGASWSPWHTPVVIIPRTNKVSSWEEVNELLRHVLSEQEH